MTIERLREAYEAHPFKPFTIRTGSGREYLVKSPEFLAMAPSGRTIVAVHDDDHVELLDLLLVESIQFNGRRQPPGRRSRRGR